MSSTEYLVYETPYVAHQEGERYIHEQDGTEGDFLQAFETLDEAITYADAMELDGPTIRRARRGLDSVGYDVVEVYEVTIGDDDSQEDSRLVHSRSSLTSAQEDAMRRHEAGYWAFLDYRADGYAHLDELI